MSTLKPARPSKKSAAPSAKRKKSPRIPAENQRLLALLEQWRNEPMSDEELQSWEETMRSFDAGRPHRPVFNVSD